MDDRHHGYGVGVRWQGLFADMELQLRAAEDAERWAPVPDLTRAERAAVPLADRLRATGSPVRLELVGGEVVDGRVVEVGDGWFLLVDGTREHLVPSAGVATVRGLAQGAAPPAAARLLGVRHALRLVARDRALVRVLHAGGEVAGRVDAVGADHVDVGLVDESRRPTGVRAAVLLRALRLVSRLG